MFSDRVYAEVGSKKILVPQGLKRPFMKDFHDFENWVRSEYDAAVDVKRRVECGQLSRRAARKEMSRWASKKRSSFAEVQELRCEERLLDINHRLRQFLGKQNRKCILLLQEMGHLKLTQLMVKKNPLVVETLRKFIKCNCGSDIEEVKFAANRMMRKLRLLFKVPDSMSFLEVYRAQMKEFKKRTVLLDSTEVQLLTTEGLTVVFESCRPMELPRKILSLRIWTSGGTHNAQYIQTDLNGRFRRNKPFGSA